MEEGTEEMGSPKPDHLLKHIMMVHNRTSKQDFLTLMPPCSEPEMRNLSVHNLADGEEEQQ